MKKHIFCSKSSILAMFMIIFASCHFTSDPLEPFFRVNFPISKKKLDTAIEKLYVTYPEYKVPEKWVNEDTSIKNAYFFLKSRTFYFRKEPEEMYYVTFLGDSTMLADTFKITIAVRSINKGTNWFKYAEISDNERERIEKRFDKEIISKLEDYTNSHATIEEK